VIKITFHGKWAFSGTDSAKGRIGDHPDTAHFQVSEAGLAALIFVFGNRDADHLPSAD
jgi:hypothetical protein